MATRIGDEAPDFTAMAGLKPEFDKRHTKIIGLSVDPVSDHKSSRRPCPTRTRGRSIRRASVAGRPSAPPGKTMTCPKCGLNETERGTVIGWYCKVCGWRESRR